MNSTSRRQTLACFLVTGAVLVGCDRHTPQVASEPARGFDRWEEAVARIEQGDRESPPPKGAVVFVGASTIVKWDLKKSFPEIVAINRGFGGSEIADNMHFAPRIILKTSPGKIVFYAGDNDIANGRTAEQVREDFRAFVEQVHRTLPKTRICFLAIKPSPARWRLVAEQTRANALVERYCQGDERLRFIDTFQPMLGADRLPRAELYQEDKLHLSDAGYELWSSLVVPFLE